MLTQERIKELIHYNPEKGDFKWLVKSNRRGVGSDAGTIRTSNGKSYLAIGLDGGLYSAHRIAWMYVKGEWPDQIDHFDGSGMNNRFSNLRSVTFGDNMKNKRLQSNNRSGVSGVTWHKPTSKWGVYIGSGKKQKYVGLFKYWFDAVCARKSEENKLNYHENHGQVRPL